MTRGRKKTPVRLRMLRGNPGKRPPGDLSAELPGHYPSCPRELKGHARREWKRLHRVLGKLRLITPADRSALMGYCLAFGRMVDAEKEVAERGMIVTTKAGNIIQNPYLSVANKAMEQMRRFIADLGLSPTSRAGLKITAPPRQDPLEAFLNPAGGKKKKSS